MPNKKISSKSLKEKRINRKTQSTVRRLQAMVSAESGDGTNMEPSKKTKDRAVGEWSGQGMVCQKGVLIWPLHPVSGLPTCGEYLSTAPLDRKTPI